MSDSLRDQLLGLGFKPAPKAQQPSKSPHVARGDRNKGKPAGRGAGQPARGKPGQPHAKATGKPPAPGERPVKSRSGEMDLAKAYAIRAQREKEERIEAERQKQEAARQRREAKGRLAERVKDKALNVAEADIARHFSYGGKIKRIYVTAPQLKALNAGELGVLQLDGRYLLVDAALLDEAETIFPPAVALKVDPEAPAGDDPYADPQYQVPDDLVW